MPADRAYSYSPSPSSSVADPVAKGSFGRSTGGPPECGSEEVLDGLLFGALPDSRKYEMGS